MLAGATRLAVRTAREHTRLCPGTVWVAHADRQLLLGPGDTLVCEELEAGGRCSADRLFGSLAARAGPRCIAVVLTGRLSDGAAGVCAVKGAGGVVLAQDPVTSASPGMPAAAVATGCVDHVVPLRRIAGALGALTARPPLPVPAGGPTTMDS